MDTGGEPSESEPTFAPPGSLPRVSELPLEEPQLADLDLGELLPERPEPSLPSQERLNWADQQDQPEGDAVTDTNLRGLDDEGAATRGR